MKVSIIIPSLNSPIIVTVLKKINCQNEHEAIGEILIVGKDDLHLLQKVGALDTLLAAPEFDLVLAVVGSSARYHPQLAVQPIIDCPASTRPLAAMIVPDAPEALTRLTAAGIPCFRSPEACGDAIAAVLGRRTPTVAAKVERRRTSSARTLSEAQAYALLDELGVARAPALVAPLAGPVPPLPFDFPVVVKVCSPDIPHKTEVGGVVLNLKSAAELDTALGTLRHREAEQQPG